jgi:hypothetical protein
VHEATPGAKGVQKYKYLIHVVAAFVFGLALILISVRWTEQSTLHDVLDELGVATIVAAVVTLMYETYAREVFTHETTKHMLETVMGDMFDNKLWDELRWQLLEKEAIRRAFTVRISLSRDPQLPQHEGVLRVFVTYRLHVLRPRVGKVGIHHYLDRFMANRALQLPRFEYVAIGSEILDVRTLPDDFKRDVVMSGEAGVPITIERREIVYTPGAYNLLMSDLTQLETVQVEELPDDVDIEVNWTLDKPHPMAPFQGCLVDRMLLPGHSIEFRFVNRDAARTRDVETTSGTTAA